jgi:hypothetical protein
VQTVQTAGNTLSGAGIPSSFTGFSTKLLINDIDIGVGRKISRGGMRVLKRQVAKGFDAKVKGCDFGYALACNSCEGAASVDACTVTALEVTTAFAVPDLG